MMTNAKVNLTDVQDSRRTNKDRATTQSPPMIIHNLFHKQIHQSESMRFCDVLRLRLTPDVPPCPPTALLMANPLARSPHLSYIAI